MGTSAALLSRIIVAVMPSRHNFSNAVSSRRRRRCSRSSSSNSCSSKSSRVAVGVAVGGESVVVVVVMVGVLLVVVVVLRRFGPDRGAACGSCSSLHAHGTHSTISPPAAKRSNLIVNSQFKALKTPETT